MTPTQGRRHRPRLRPRSRVAIAIAAALTAGLLAVPAQAQPAPPPAAVQDGPGSVVTATPLSGDAVPGGVAHASVLKYRTTGPQNAPALSTGAVFVPPGNPPPGGWPVISWAHGTVGIADACAPTVSGKMVGPYLQRWLTQGYALVATDYVGLGTPGVHPYLDGPSEAHSVIDMVRAARAVTPSLSDRWVALGQSQGGQAAMVTASIATTYAPELDYRGVVATGVPANLDRLAPLVGPGFPELPLEGTTVFIAYALAGLRAAQPNLGLDSYLSPVGLRVLDQVQSLCYADAAPLLAGISIGDLMSRQLDDPVVLDAVRQSLHVPASGYDRPVFLGQGLLDTMVPAPFALTLAAEMAVNRQDMVFRTYPAGHIETMLAAQPEAMNFVRGLFGG